MNLYILQRRFPEIKNKIDFTYDPQGRLQTHVEYDWQDTKGLINVKKTENFYSDLLDSTYYYRGVNSFYWEVESIELVLREGDTTTAFGIDVENGSKRHTTFKCQTF